jgi:outer membrane protein insertion porin family
LNFALLTFLASPLTAQVAAPTITEIRVEQEGVPVTDRLIIDLIETTIGNPLSMRDVRETMTHLTNLGRFEDVQVFREPVAGGIRLRYVLVPVHAVDRVEFRGSLGLSDGELRRAVTERFGAAPPAGRADDVVRTVATLYRDRGYVRPRITPRIEPTHNPDRATMVLDIDAGPRATIQRVDVERVPAAERASLLEAVGIKIGQPYESDAIQRRLEAYENNLRSHGYYEARAQHDVSYPAPTQAEVTLTLDQGPLVSVAFAGDLLPEADRDRLVPVRSEGSVDEDLLEDATRAIEEYLFARGYRDARVTYARDPGEGQLTLTFTVTRGPRYVTDMIEITGNTAIPTRDVLEILRVKPEEPFVQATVEAGASSIREGYRARGYTRAAIQPSITTLSRASDGVQNDDRRVRLRINVVEGPRTLVGSLAIEGNRVLSEGALRTVMTSAPGRPYSEVEIASDRDRIDLEYRNRGYESVVVDPHVAMTDQNSRADVRFVVSEGPQVIVDRVIIVGNTRTNTNTIQRELLLGPGEPVGYSALLESRQRLSALGLFRNVRISELTHTGESRRDILVEVEEAPPTTIGYGGGIEGGTRLRPTGAAGQAEERFEVAPRGFFEVGRRNLWGKNRSVNLFTRVSLRSRDIVLSDSGVRLDRPAEGSGYGFNEYRVLGNYREPRIFDTRADLLVTAILDQAIRSSFNFRKRELRGEAGLRLSTRYSVAGRYSFEHTRLFDERFTDEEKPLIDRVFPQVRLSKFSASFIRDTRDDALDPNRGNFFIVDNVIAARAVGSEVGFFKTYVQGFTYHRLPPRRRTVVGLAGRVGAAQGFRRTVERPDSPVVDVVQNLPASERFFAGGDTTVRGFSLDRLGTAETISPAGFPKGGNGVIVVNAELRVALYRGLTGVGFLDAGNVFARATGIDLTDLRRAAGFGVVYGSPVGPIRINLGFKLDRRELSPGRLERRSVLHISLGQAF